MRLTDLPIFSVTDLLRGYQRRTPSQLARLDPEAYLNPASFTRLAINEEDSTCTVSTNQDDFPVQDSNTEIVEVICLQHTPERFYFAVTLQAKRRQPSQDSLIQAAELFGTLLTAPGCHCGFTGHADTSYTTTTRLYVTTPGLELIDVHYIGGESSVFSVGHNSVAVQEAGSFAMMDIPQFIKRAEHGRDLIRDREGLSTVPLDARLTRGAIDAERPLMALKAGCFIHFYDANYQEVPGLLTSLRDRDMYLFPRVDRQGYDNNSNQLVLLRAYGQDEGRDHGRANFGTRASLFPHERPNDNDELSHDLPLHLQRPEVHPSLDARSFG